MAEAPAGAAWEGHLFSGAWGPGEAGTVEVVEKATDAVLATVGLAGPGDVATATVLAAAAQDAWAAVPGRRRGEILRAAGAEVQRRAPDLEHWLVREAGSIPPKAQWEIGYAADRLIACAAYATMPHGEIVAPAEPEQLSLAQRVPVGVVGEITPWNAPLALAVRGLAPALALGNAVVLKPDVQTPISGGLLLAEILLEAGLPEDVFHVLPGGADVGEALICDPRVGMITFTGSTAVGRRVGALAGEHLKRVSLELGGNNAIIVLEDADLEASSSAASFGAFFHQGQICMTAGRHLVHESIAEAYAEQLATRAKALPVGDPATDEVALGPIVNAKQAERVQRIVDETVAAGAKVVAGGAADGRFFPATVLTGVTPGMAAFQEEIFGPVAPITTFASDDEAVELVNSSDQGLVASIQTDDPARALAIARRLKVGMVHVNDQTINDEPNAPLGGFGSSGNGGRFGTQSELDEFTQWQWVTVRRHAKRYPF